MLRLILKFRYTDMSSGPRAYAGHYSTRHSNARLLPQNYTVETGTVSGDDSAR